MLLHALHTTMYSYHILCVLLQYSDRLTHLGHILSSNLTDNEDIIQVFKDMNCKANTVLCTFGSADPLISYCLSLCGCTFWSLSSPSMRIVEVALNKIMWNLPRHSILLLYIVLLLSLLCVISKHCKMLLA